MGSRYRCRVSPTGVAGCEGTGGTGSGEAGPTGPTGPSSDEPDEEAFATTEEDETVVALTIDIGEDELLRAGAVWIGTDGSGDLVVHEATFALKRVGAGATEVGVHDNGTVRNVIEGTLVGAASDYVPTATGVDLTVQGVVGKTIDWTVQTWFTRYPI